MSDLKKRTITGIIGAILLGTVLYLGGIYLKIAVLIISLIASFELTNALKKIDISVNMLSIVIGIISLNILNYLKLSGGFSIILVVLLNLTLMIFYDRFSLTDAAYTTLVFIYAPFLFNYLLCMHNAYYLYMIFIIAFSTDTCAYFIGSMFGKHKLIERVSPKKSVEGAVGGVLGCLIITLIYFYFTGIKINYMSIIFIIIASVSGQIGDLTASKIKRIVGIKDYGKILPGHGGIMDRFDSIITVTPIVYILYYINVLY